MRTFVALFSLLAFAAPLHAQYDVKQATKNFKAELKQLTKEHQATLKAELAGLKAGLKAATLPFKSGDGGQADAADVFDLLRDYQSAVFVAHSEANDAFDRLADELSGFEDDPETPEFYPPGFSAGDGGLLDDYIAGVQARVEQNYASIRKQLAKLTKLAAKKSGVLLSSRLLPVAAMREASANPNGSFAVNAIPVVIDTVLAFSDPEFQLANRIYVSGTALPSVLDATLTLAGPVDTEVTTEIDNFTGRFELSFSVMGGLPRGNYTIRAQSGSDLTSAVIAIGLR